MPRAGQPIPLPPTVGDSLHNRSLALDKPPFEIFSTIIRLAEEGTRNNSGQAFLHLHLMQVEAQFDALLAGLCRRAGFASRRAGWGAGGEGGVGGVWACGEGVDRGGFLWRVGGGRPEGGGEESGSAEEAEGEGRGGLDDSLVSLPTSFI